MWNKRPSQVEFCFQFHSYWNVKCPSASHCTVLIINDDLQNSGEPISILFAAFRVIPLTDREPPVIEWGETRNTPANSEYGNCLYSGYGSVAEDHFKASVTSLYDDFKLDRTGCNWTVCLRGILLLETDKNNTQFIIALESRHIRISLNIASYNSIDSVRFGYGTQESNHRSDLQSFVGNKVF